VVDHQDGERAERQAEPEQIRDQVGAVELDRLCQAAERARRAADDGDAIATRAGR
jgi:hypothetical protein